MNIEMTMASGKSLCRGCCDAVSGKYLPIPKFDKAVLITSPCVSGANNGTHLYLCEKHAREFLAKMTEVMDGGK
jgi:hypothetical protein